jgi:catechol 2,3-dioxygenase-like lactoylglutathione lyase family enzyme
MAIMRILPYLEGDFAAVKAFYVDGLGLEVAMDGDDFLGLRSAAHRQVQLVVSAPGVEQPLPHMGIDLGTPEAVDAARAAAQARGLEVLYGPTDEPWGIYRCFVRDPTGRIVSLLAHRA